jgi:hypothetical protein
VVVTDDDIRVCLPFPFSIFAYELDLEHRIPLTSITGLEQWRHWLGTSLLLDYTGTEGHSYRIELML